MFFKELIEKNRFSFFDGFEDWKDAIATACKPLIKDNAIEEIYVNEIIKKVSELGPYIVIGPEICIPHAQEGFGVNETAICFMNTKLPVKFDKEDDEYNARIFFVLASENNDKHLQNLMALSDMLSNDEIVQKLKSATCKQDLIDICELI